MIVRVMTCSASGHWALLSGGRRWPTNLCSLALKPWTLRPWNLRLQIAGAQIPSLESRISQRIPMGSFRFQRVPWNSFGTPLIVQDSSGAPSIL